MTSRRFTLTGLSLFAATAAAVPTTAALAADAPPPPAAAALGDKASPLARAHSAFVVVPDGWKRTDPPGGPVTFTSGADYRAKIFVAAVPPDVKPTLREQMAAEREAGAKQNPTFKAEGDPVAGRHPAGYDVLVQRFSFDQGGIQFLPRRAQFIITLFDGGPEAPAMAVMYLADDPEVFADQLPAYKKFVADVRLPSRTVLAEGPGGQKLTLNTVLRVGDFLEWLLETPFTAAQRDELQAYLVDAYKRADAGEIAAVQEVHKVRAQLDKLTAEQRDFAREAARVEAMKEWREEARKGDRLAKRMVEIYDAGRAALATGDDGDPPLTRQAADASLEAVYFMASKVAFPNGPESHPTPAQLDAWAKDLAAQYKEMPRAKKDDLAGMTALWAKLRLAWPEMSTAERAAVLEEWAKLPLVKQTAEQVKANRPAEEARRLGQIYRNYDAHQQLLYMGAYNLYQRPLYSYR